MKRSKKQPMSHKHGKQHSSRIPRSTQGITLISGESDERNANVQQSGRLAEPDEGDPWGDRQMYGKKKSDGPFTPGQLGQPDQDPRPGDNNPQGVQSGRGPLHEEGEGDRQNDALAELESGTEEKEDFKR